MTDTALNVLIVADREDDARHVLAGLRYGGYDPRWKQVRTADAMRDALSVAEWDVVMSDYALSRFDAAAALDVLDEMSQDIPLLVISDEKGLDRVAALVRKGASDFLAKDDPNGFASVVERELGEREARRQSRQSAEEIRRLANLDPLTELPNRRLFNDRLSQGMKRARRQKTFLPLLFVDLDHFKSINDTLGHRAGDCLLEEVARRLRSCIRDSDTAARLGGDEFAIVLGDSASMQTGEWVARKVLDSLSEPFHIDGCEAFITASIGIAVFPLDGDDAEALLAGADTAMYRVKKRGRNGFSRHLPGEEPEAGAYVPRTSAPFIPGVADTEPPAYGAPEAAVAAGRDETGRTPRLMFWATVLPISAVAVILGWLVLAPLMSILWPDDSSVIATDELQEMELDYVPASGPDDPSVTATDGLQETELDYAPASGPDDSPGGN